VESSRLVVPAVEHGVQPTSVHIPSYCPVCGFSGLRAIFLAMNFKKEGA
jgi:hypothetical protein